VTRADPFHAIADPTRRAILDRLRKGEAAVAELAAGFAVSRPAVSKHLRVLRDARLVREHRGTGDARQRVYELSPAPLREVVAWAQDYQVFWQVTVSNLERCLEDTARRRR
jgi:DNA-binding transcriptional ArsR family regulator